jgi:hypothetical protein
MDDRFAARSLVATRTSESGRNFELTFVGANGKKHTISMPVALVAELAPVLQSLADGIQGRRGGEFTKLPKQLAVGNARHERLVLVKFDDDPPYALDPDVAESLWRGVREETENVARRKVPALQ